MNSRIDIREQVFNNLFIDTVQGVRLSEFDSDFPGIQDLLDWKQ